MSLLVYAHQQVNCYTETEQRDTGHTQSISSWDYGYCRPLAQEAIYCVSKLQWNFPNAGGSSFFYKHLISELKWWMFVSRNDLTLPHLHRKPPPPGSERLHPRGRSSSPKSSVRPAETTRAEETKGQIKSHKPPEVSLNTSFVRSCRKKEWHAL